MVRSLTEWTFQLPRRLEGEMENLFEPFFGPVERPVIGFEGFVPRTNVAETDGGFEVSVELPGMKAEEFDVELKDESLWITGEKKEERGKEYHRVQRHHGEFRRVIPLPIAIEETEISATYTDGVLTVRVPKAADVQPKHIEIKTCSLAKHREHTRPESLGHGARVFVCAYLAGGIVSWN